MYLSMVEAFVYRRIVRGIRASGSLRASDVYSFTPGLIRPVRRCGTALDQRYS